MKIREKTSEAGSCRERERETLHLDVKSEQRVLSLSVTQVSLSPSSPPLFPEYKTWSLGRKIALRSSSGQHISRLWSSSSTWTILLPDGEIYNSLYWRDPLPPSVRIGNPPPAEEEERESLDSIRVKKDAAAPYVADADNCNADWPGFSVDRGQTRRKTAKKKHAGTAAVDANASACSLIESTFSRSAGPARPRQHFSLLFFIFFQLSFAQKKKKGKKAFQHLSLVYVACVSMGTTTSYSI